MTKLNRLLSLGLISLTLLLWACSGGVSGTGDGAEPVASSGDEPSSGASSAGSEEPDLVLQGVALDSAANRILGIDILRKAVISIDLTHGTPHVLSDRHTPDGVNAFEDPQGIAIDEAGNRALVVDAGLKAIIAVDLTTGARSLFSAKTIPNGQVPFKEPSGIVIDNANSRALVTDRGLPSVVAVDLSTGNRALLQGN